MADKITFPIGFDLKSAVDKAAEEWDNTYAAKLERKIQARPLSVKLRLSEDGLANLDDVKRRLAEIKIEPLTTETKTAIRELTRELEALARALEKASKYSVSSVGTSAVRGAKVDKYEAQAAAARELARQRAARAAAAESKLEIARLRAAAAADRAAAATRNANREYKAQDGYISRLVKRLAVYAGFRQISNFLTSVREVTAQFELQRVSLGAIIQDQARANQLFSEIKQFAIKSPVSIMDLTKYTKQLAAYKIGVDELFETTKKLTDVSVGLGVSMDRVVLAYGQTRATGYLRASEIRQFTEMGVPIVEELAKKLSQMNGELVTSAQVLDMVSKRAISFGLVKEVFDDMTSAGGMFYEMQEKQGNTLYGMWAKLGDAASIVYDEIGNTEGVNKGMKITIELLTKLMRNWKDVARIVAIGSIGGAIMKINTSLQTLRTNVASANKKYIAAANEHRLALKAEQNARAAATAEEYKAIVAKTKSTEATYMAARAEYLAARNTTLWSKALNKLKAAFAGNWVTLLLTIGTMIASHFLFAEKAGEKLRNKLKEIKSEAERASSESVSNFESLANRAVGAADGSREQKDALEELNNTYGNNIPYEQLTIENLRKMRVEYDKLPDNIKKTTKAYSELTDMIEAYNTKLRYQNEVNAIKEDYGTDEKELRGELRDALTDETLKVYKDTKSTPIDISFGESSIRLFLDSLDKFSTTAKNDTEAVRLALESIWDDFGGKLGPARTETGQFSHALDDMTTQVIKSGKSFYENTGPLLDYVEVLRNKNTALNEAKNAYDSDIQAQNEYAVITENTQKKIQELGKYKYNDEGSYSEYLENEKAKIQEVYNGVAEIIGKENTDIITANNDLVSKFNEGKITYATLLDELLKLPLSAKARQEIQNIQKMYRELAPTDQTVVAFDNKFKALAQTMEVSMFKVQRNMMKQGQTLEEHRKVIVDEIDDINKKILTLVATKALMAAQGYDTTDIEAQIQKEKELLAFYEKYLTFIPSFEKKKKKSGGSKQDPRMQNLKEEISLVQKLYQEYKQLEKQEGASKAASDMNRMAKDSIAMLSKKYGISLPKTATDVVSALEILYGEMAQLPKEVFPALDKDLKELRWTIEKVDIDDSQANIEKSLKELADRISRTKTAKEFYEKILSQTGDVELAVNLSLHIYGENGEDLNKTLQEEIQTLLGKGTKSGLDLDFSAAIRQDGSIDYKELAKIAKGYLDLGEISDDTYNKILKMRDDDRKDMAKTVDGWLKATEKAKTYSDKLLDVRRKTQTEIDKINKAEANGDITPDFAKSQREGYLRKEAEEVAKLQYEAFKDSPMYVQMFDDLDHASTTMLQNMKQRLTDLQGEWKNLDPKQLKEMQSRLNEIDKQLATRNPFKGIVDGIKDYRKLRKGGDDGLGPKSSKEADKALDEASKARIDAEKKYLEVLNDEKSTAEDIENAKNDLDNAMANEQSAQKAVENWKKVKDVIGLSANEIFSMLNMAGDIAKGIADISEVMGADKEDVQYWNDVSSALGEIGSGIQDIVTSAMSGNVIGIISSAITAIPKMFVGFTNLFSAGKIRKANKEINRQQKLLEQLEYTYGRLEKAAEKAFGGDYINNFKQQQANLQAQQLAYEKQLEAEKSKGKKADKEKIKEYEEKIRDVKDEIADIQGTIAEKMLGTDLTSAARDFAQAWLDAYKEFGNTADKMSEKFKEMVENMVVESMLAKVMEKALQPMFNMIDKMGTTDFYNEDFWRKVVDEAEKGANAANVGASTMMKYLEKAGISVRDLGGEMTGISRDIASASEESINGLAAGINTQNYYIAQQLTEVQAIRALLESGKTTSVSSDVIQWQDWQQQAMDNFNAIQRNTAETVAECRRAANETQRSADYVKSVIGIVGNGKAINVVIKG